MSPALEEYIDEHTYGLPPVLYELDRYTRLHHLYPQMLSGPVQGMFLQMFCQAIQARKVLEIGTYTGYTAICMALGMPDGKLTSFDINEETTDTAQKFAKKAGVEKSINFLIGDAKDEILELKEKDFDLAFIDADKENYSNYFDLVMDRVRPGGWILADNVLWSGKVIEAETDAQTEAIKAFNDKVQQDKRVKNVILSIRDGILMAQKIN